MVLLGSHHQTRFCSETPQRRVGQPGLHGQCPCQPVREIRFTLIPRRTCELQTSRPITTRTLAMEYSPECLSLLRRLTLRRDGSVPRRIESRTGRLAQSRCFTSRCNSRSEEKESVESSSSSSDGVTGKRPILDYRLSSMVSQLLGISQRMPWLSGLLALSQHLILAGPGRLGDTDGVLDR